MRGPRGWKEYWRSHKGPFQRPWQYRGLKRKDEKEEDDFIAQVAVIAAVFHHARKKEKKNNPV